MLGSLREAKNDVALRGFGDLDELDLIDVRVLAWICAHGEVKVELIAIAVSIDSHEYIHKCVETLYRCGFLDNSDEGYVASEAGLKAMRAVGIEMLGMDLFRMRNELQASQRILNKLKSAS